MDQKSPEAFRTISEVAEWLGVPTHVLRFWESRFSQVKPVKRAGGRRYYRPADMELLGGIRKLLHEDGMTIRGVQKLLREQGVKHVAGMSPPLDLGADTQDVTPSNVVDLSERRGEDTEEADDSAWEAEASSAPEAETSAEPDRADDDASEPDEELDPFWRDDYTPTPDDADPFESPERVAFHANDAEPDAFEGAEMDAAPPPADFTPPEPDPEPMPDAPDPADPMASPEALDFAAHEAEPETAEAKPEPPADAAPAPPPPAPEAHRPALVMPEIGPDPDDGAFYPDTPPVAAQLRAARAAEVDFPVETLWALADRLGALASRTGADSAPRG